MITWDHVRFLALLIPTWLLLGAVAVTLAVPAKGRAGTSFDENVVQAGVSACRGLAAAAAQQGRQELIAAAQWDRAHAAAEYEE